ncbi:hypothetical protein [Autumnicola musiva]|uniref:Glycosyltransferase n=1 Tax=Autumnicola musiva TaxID=3075589 RepID=A0ABU3D824_9FLAO|nr:hypothetical protein [Zunongwangia sp. F117]MDT0677678.1 hypothetical protein [Zunongwangia sp. F117]
MRHFYQKKTARKSKVLHIIKTSKFFSDGRLLKWINSLHDFNINSKVIILEDDNKKGEFTYNNATVKTINLAFRSIFPQRKGYLFKIPEYSLKTYLSTMRSSGKVIVFHDMQHYLTLLLLTLKKPKRLRIVWDLHELPHQNLCRNFLTRKLLKGVLEKVDLLVYTNRERREYMQKQIGYNEKRHVLLQNFPGKDFIQSPKKGLDPEVLQWLDNKPYVLWMGWASEGRNFKPALEALQGYKNELKLIILGPVEAGMKEAVDEEIEKGFIYQKFVPQIEIINYVDNALFSIVLYKNSSPNNFLCEPNRLYQLLSRNVPVICGFNPPMKNVVEKVKGGIVLKDDGSEIESIKRAIATMLKNKLMYKENLINTNKENLFSWEEQFENVENNLKELLTNY